jgi:hypothetical protein
MRPRQRHVACKGDLLPAVGAMALRIHSMDRRRFLAASSVLVASPAWAGLMCIPSDVPDVPLCHAGVRRDIAEIPAAAPEGQHLSQWCWAACIETVFRYHGFVVPQARIVQETFGTIAEWPDEPEHVLAYLERAWEDDHKRPFRVEGVVYDADPAVASEDLSHDMPLILGAAGRPMVLTELSFLRNPNGRGEVKRATVGDPAPGAGVRELSVSEWGGTRVLARLRVWG